MRKTFQCLELHRSCLSVAFRLLRWLELVTFSASVSAHKAGTGSSMCTNRGLQIIHANKALANMKHSTNRSDFFQQIKELHALTLIDSSALLNHLKQNTTVTTTGTETRDWFNMHWCVSFSLCRTGINNTSPALQLVQAGKVKAGKPPGYQEMTTSLPLVVVSITAMILQLMSESWLYKHKEGTLTEILMGKHS